MKHSDRVFYADQPAGLALGASVARLSFGVVDLDSEQVDTVVTVAMPVESLVMLVNDLTAALNAQGFKESTVSGLKRAIKVVEKGVDGEPSVAMRSIVEEKAPKAKKRQKRSNT